MAEPNRVLPGDALNREIAILQRHRSEIVSMLSGALERVNELKDELGRVDDALSEIRATKEGSNG